MCGDVALHAGGSCKMWMGFFTLINFVVSPGQVRVIEVVAVEGAVVNIHAFAAICDGKLML